MDYEELRKDVVQAGIRMYRDGLTHETSGNISCRIPGRDKILVTPSRIEYESMKPRDVMLVGFDGEPEEGGRSPSVETPFHLEIYKAREDVGAIVHSHSIYALAVAAAGKTVPVFLDEIFSNIGGELVVAEYELPGSEELAENVRASLNDKDAVLLANHGAVCCGADLEEAYAMARTVEKICRVYILAASLGGVRPLPEDGVEYQEMMYEMKKDF